MTKDLKTLEHVRAEYERLYNEADADEDTNLHARLRILSQTKDVLQQTALEQKLDALERLVEQRLSSVTPLKRVG